MKHRVRSALFVALLTAVGCGGGGEPPEPRPQAAESRPPGDPSVPPPAPPAPMAEEHAPRSIPLARLGFDAEPRPPMRAAAAHAREGRQELRRGDLEGALTAFEAAIAIDSTYTDARFQRARILAKMRRLADAATELAPLFERDVAEIYERYAQEGDFAELRATPEGAALAAHRDAVSAAYAQAIPRGLRSVTYRRHAANFEVMSMEVADDQRAGVFVQPEGRFLPLTPEYAHAYAVAFDPQMKSVAVLHGGRAVAMYQVSPTDVVAESFSLVTPGRRVARLENADRAFLRHFPALRERLENEEAPFFEMGLRPFSDGFELEVYPSGRGPTLRLNVTESGDVVAAEPRAEPSYRVRVDTGAMQPDAIPEGYAVARGRLTIPGRAEPIDLGPSRGDATVFLSQDGSAVIVLTRIHQCAVDGSGVAHRLVRVDPSTAVVEQLSRGPTFASLVDGPDGTHYLQLGGETKRLSPTGRLEDSGLPPWVHLAVEVPSPDCSM